MPNSNNSVLKELKKIAIELKKNELHPKVFGIDIYSRIFMETQHEVIVTKVTNSLQDNTQDMKRVINALEFSPVPAELIQNLFDLSEDDKKTAIQILKDIFPPKEPQRTNFPEGQNTKARENLQVNKSNTNTNSYDNKLYDINIDTLNLGGTPHNVSTLREDNSKVKPEKNTNLAEKNKNNIEKNNTGFTRL